LQSRCVSTGLKNKLIGGHIEHYFFYCKLRDLADATDIAAMLLDTTPAGSVNTASGDNAYYHVASGAPEWLEMCTDAVVTAYFRDQGDTASHVGAVTGLPMVQWSNQNSIMESLIADADIETTTIADTTPSPQYEAQWNSWAWMKQMQLTEMTFEDYLASFGVQLKTDEDKRPELIRMTKNWTYPTNTVDGEGNINTQFSWSVQERVDKDRFFKEPGFIVGYTVFRPKLYFSGMKQAAVSMMSGALSWLPASAKENVATSLVRFQANSANSPFGASGTPSAGELDSDLHYWVDIRDLFVYGDQFMNVTRDGTVNAVRSEDLVDFQDKKYPQSAALQLIGVGDTLSAAQDGVVSLNILGTQMDMT